MTVRTIIIGTRGSDLAMWQAQAVAHRLRAAGVSVDITKIVTTGDVDQRPIPAGAMGKAWFTAEIDRALAEGGIHVAVHSMKDLSPQERDGFATFPVLERGDARDALVSLDGCGLDGLKPGSVVGTDSVRRRAALARIRPDLRVVSIRGNVGTRLRKLAEEPYDALILAAAGLNRLGLQERICEYLRPEEFVPSPGQGVLAAQCLDGDAEVGELARGIVVDEVAWAFQAERAFSAAIGGGCKEPVGCYATISGGLISISGLVGTDDARGAVVATASADVADRLEAARELAGHLQAEAGR